MSDELIERVAAAIAEIRELPVEGGTVPVEFGPQSAAIIATAAVRAVRQYDVEIGPSEAELKAGWCQVNGVPESEFFEGTVFPPLITAVLDAAAVERAREAGVG